MNGIKKWLFLLLLISDACLAQQTPIPYDTSFTVYSTYIKERKKRPFIEIAKSELPQGVSMRENMVYSTVDTHQLHADVYYPAAKSKKGYPGILLIFGGGWRSGDITQSIPLAQQLAARGYVSVAIAYRLTLEAPYPAAVFDIKAAIRWMRAHAKEFNLDPAKIADLGVSAGGQLASLVGTTNGDPKFEGTGGNAKQSSAIQAIVDIDGILAFKHPESEEGAVAAQWLGGTYEQVPETWKEASALTHVDKRTGPTLFINSSNPRFHAGRTDFIDVLNKYGTYSEIHTFPDTPHPFWFFHPWFNDTVKFTADFLDKVFK